MTARTELDIDQIAEVVYALGGTLTAEVAAKMLPLLKAAVRNIELAQSVTAAEARAMPAIIRNYATGVEIRPATTRESERYFEIAGTLPVIDGQASAVEGLDVAYDLDCMIYIDPPAAAIVPRDA